MHTARTLSAIPLSACLGMAAATAANPDQTVHRTSPVPVPWEIAEPAVSLPAFAQKLSSDRRPSDFEFAWFYTRNGVGISQLSYHSLDVENTAQFEMGEQFVVGPAPTQTVIDALEQANLRPIDIEYDRFNEPPVMTALAVPNTGDNFADWYIKTDASPSFIDGMTQTFPVQYRPVDIEYAEFVDDGGDGFFLYAIIAVQNSSAAATGGTQWWFRGGMTQSEILQNQQALGRILDLEVQGGRPRSSPRWDAIFIPWDEGRPVYNHVASLASPTYSDPDRRSSIPRYFTDEFSPETNDFEFDLPGLTAGFRLTDIEYYHYWVGNDAYLKTDGAFVDAATRLQFFARDAFGDAATESPLQSTDRCAFHASEIGAAPDIPGVHPQGRPVPDFDLGGRSVPAHIPFTTAYAVLNDDLDLTEQQLNTCDPLACPPPTNICDPQLFTIRELLERMRDLQDYSAAQTLIEERYIENNVEEFIHQLAEGEPCPFNCNVLVDLSIDQSGRFCDARVSLGDLTTLIVAMTDGTLGDAQSRADFLEYMFVPAPIQVDAAIDAVIDDEASETDLTATEVRAFKEAMTRRWRELTAQTFARIGEQNNVPVTRRTTFAFVGLPVYDSSTDTTTPREFSINTYLESETDDATPLHEITAEALRDAIADALAAWEGRPAGCSDADFAEPFGTLDLADIVAFVTAFTGNDPAADLDQSGLFDLADIVAFVTAFNAGCP